MGDEIRQIVGDWVVYLREIKLWGNDDPLFPATRVAIGASRQFEVSGLKRTHWRNASPIRLIFREACANADVPYFNPRWGARAVTDLKPRPVEQWLESLPLSSRSKGFIRSLVHAIWDYAMWSDMVPTQANPARLVRIADVSKRQRQPHPLAMSAFQTFVRRLDEPFRTIACVCVCFGLRISECLALKWSDINWLEGKLSIQRSIVRQRVEDVKTAYSKKTMPVDSEMLKVLESWRSRTQFSSDDDWVFASPVQLGRLPWSADAVSDAYKKATSVVEIGHVSTHTMRHTYRSWLDAVGTSIAVQQKLMRHADIRTTMNVYGDVVTDEMEQAHSKVVRMALAPVN